jgi:hypothetical protein
MRTRAARSRTRSSLVALAVAFSTLSTFAVASLAQALTINTATSSLDQGIGCSSASFCFPGFNIYDLDASAPLSGSFDLTGGTTLDFSINLASATLSVVSGPDGGVTSVEFFDVTFSGSVAVVLEPSGVYSVTDQAANVSGTLIPTGAGSPVVFNLSGVNTSGPCNDAPGLSLTCGLIFGVGTPMEIEVNGQPRYFTLTTDIRSVVPEPSTALLMGLGLGVLAKKQSRARSHRSSD